MGNTAFWVLKIEHRKEIQLLLVLRVDLGMASSIKMTFSMAKGIQMKHRKGTQWLRLFSSITLASKWSICTLEITNSLNHG